MNVIKPPTPIEFGKEEFSIFLAGSIEMGKASDWQQKVTDSLADLDITILNPRRDDWDSSWEQTIENSMFKEQVEWELQGLEQASFRVFHFEAGTMSPITLMELGLCAEMGNNIVHCAEGFWRKGNVDIVCARYGIEQANTLAEAIAWLRTKIQ